MNGIRDKPIKILNKFVYEKANIDSLKINLRSDRMKLKSVACQVVSVLIIFTIVTLPVNVFAINSDFTIKDYVLLEYNGDGGDVTIPNGVKQIGMKAFYGCYDVTSVKVPSTVTSIGNYAFGYCSSLISVDIPNSVKSFGESVFYDCYSLEHVTIPNTIDTIKCQQFAECSSLTEITIPESVLVIERSAFANCGLKSLNIPSSVFYIDDAAFLGCKFKSVVIPDTVYYIGSGAFSDCANLTDIKLSKNLSEIDMFAFERCTSLKSVIIPGMVSSIKDEAFCGCSSLASATIPSSVKEIGRDSFSDCGNLTIYCEYGSYAENYAAGYFIPYVPKLATPVAVEAISYSYNSIDISWNAVKCATGYSIYRYNDDKKTYDKLSVTSKTSYINTSLTTGKVYYYKVQAYKTVNGKNTYSDYSAIVSSKPVPEKPISIKAISGSYNSIKLSWSAVSGATGYEVYRSTSKSGTYSLLKTVTAVSLTDNSLTTGKMYYYKIRAYSTANGTKYYGSFTAVVSAKPVPAVPGSFTAKKAGSTSVKLSWKSVTGASGYEVYKSTSNAGTYSLVKGTTSLSFTNTGLTKNKAYYYKVRAYKNVNGIKVYGSFTAVKSAKV